MAKKITVEEAIERFSEVTKIVAEAIFAQIESPGAQWIADVQNAALKRERKKRNDNNGKPVFRYRRL